MQLDFTAPPAEELAWAEFHKANPSVYAAFERFALEALARRHRIGARMIWERMRWELLLSTRGGGEFKLNDHYTPFYARLFMREHPEHAGCFEVRGRGRDASGMVA